MRLRGDRVPGSCDAQLSRNRRPAGRPYQGGTMKGIIAALALGLALPAFADRGDTNKDIKDATNDAVDTAKDKLGTDSGTAKAKRHAKKAARDTKRKARHTRNNVKRDLGVK